MLTLSTDWGISPIDSQPRLATCEPRAAECEERYTGYMAVDTCLMDDSDVGSYSYRRVVSSVVHFRLVAGRHIVFVGSVLYHVLPRDTPTSGRCRFSEKKARGEDVLCRRRLVL